MSDDPSVDDDVTHEVAHEESGGRGRLLPVFLLAALAVGATVLYRRSQSADADLDAESEDAEADLATAQ